MLAGPRACPRDCNKCTHPSKVNKREINEGESERGEPSLDSRALQRKILLQGKGGCVRTIP